MSAGRESHLRLFIAKTKEDVYEVNLFSVTYFINSPVLAFQSFISSVIPSTIPFDNASPLPALA